jgi:hypothetical protein
MPAVFHGRLFFVFPGSFWAHPAASPLRGSAAGPGYQAHLGLHCKEMVVQRRYAAGVSASIFWLRQKYFRFYPLRCRGKSFYGKIQRPEPF